MELIFRLFKCKRYYGTAARPCLHIQRLHIFIDQLQSAIYIKHTDMSAGTFTLQTLPDTFPLLFRASYPVILYSYFYPVVVPGYYDPEQGRRVAGNDAVKYAVSTRG